jgi:hypothetical protein
VLLFDPLRPLSTRLVNAFTTTDATTEMVKDAKSINRKLQGKRAKTIQAPIDLMPLHLILSVHPNNHTISLLSTLPN